MNEKTESMVRGYPPASFIFTAKNITDMRDGQEVSGPDGEAI